MKKGELVLKSLALEKPLVSLENFLEDFVYSQTGPASIKILKKNTRIGEFMVCNEILSKRDGILVADYIGLTSYDIGQLLHYKESVLNHAMDADNQIFSGALTYTQYKQIIPINSGLFAIEEVTKRPVLDKRNKVIGLLGYANDITNRLELFSLFIHYQKQQSIKTAIQNFLSHIKIQHYFYTLPTKRELETLLIMRCASTTKYIAKVMQLSPKTVEENKSRLRNNLKLIALNDLVVKLRSRNEL